MAATTDFTLVIYELESNKHIQNISLYNREQWTSKSSYFEAYLERWSRVKHVLSTKVPVSLPAAHCAHVKDIVNFINNSEKPSATTIEEWWGILSLAERWDIQELVTECVQFLKAHTYSIGKEYLLSYYDSFSPLQNIDSLVDVMKEAIFMLYGDNMSSLYYRNDLLKEFITLPFLAVKTLFQHPDMLASHENVRLLLLDRWVRENDTDEDEREQMSTWIRVMNLSVSFITNVLTRMTWFTINPEQVNVILHQKVMALFSENDMSPSIVHRTVEVSTPSLPIEWTLPSRSIPCESLSFTLTKPFSLLNHWIDEEKEVPLEFRTPSLAWHGMNFQLLVTLDRSGYLFLKIMCDVDGVPLDTMISGTFRQRYKLIFPPRSFCCRSFQEICLNEETLTCKGDMSLIYLRHVFTLKECLQFKCIIEKNT